MTSAAATSQKIGTEPEYDIYIFHPSNGQALNHAWERRETVHCPREAIRTAEELHNTDLYPRIEIRVKYFDRRKNAPVDRTLRIYTKAPLARRKSLFFPLILTALATAFGSVGLFLLDIITS